MVSGETTGLDVKLPAGTRIVIGGLMENPGSTSTNLYYLYYTGGVYFENT
jgi:hypothetical protein